MDTLNLADKENKYSVYSYALLTALVIFFHFDLIVKDPLSLRDDVVLISGVQSVTSLGDYLYKLQDGYLYDIQPIRDLTFYLNLKSFDYFGYSGFHLINVLLLLSILYFFRVFLKRLGFRESSILLGIALLALHPVINSTTAWVSNRKHLLSILFILLYALECQKEKRKDWKAFVWVLLSFLSQPITIFIPTLYIIYKKIFLKEKTNGWEVGIVFLTGIVLALNYYLYKTNIRFLARNEIDASADIGIYILKLSRIPVQILTPFSLAVEYDPGNLLSFFGIFLTVVIAYLWIKKGFVLKEVILSLIILTSLFPVVRWGVRDPYLLLALLLSSYFAIKIIEKYSFKKVLLLLLPYFVFLSYNSIKFTKMWSNDLLLHQVSFEVEGGPENSFRYATVLSMIDPERAYDIYNQVLQMYPNFSGPTTLIKMAEALYNSKMGDQEKLSKFQSVKEPDIFHVFFEAKLLKKMGQLEKYKNATKALKESLELQINKNIFSGTACLTYKEDCRELGLVPENKSN